ncbi:DUF3907 family protein [Metabacillus iocasae]|uniref:DUF3907 family protein n=1 Tax=Priestia iocasae TaxID=2291674 RepID=A0ABS2QR30_9BACI|nr:DUF3907 family protein [Metabacillus iocasae]MBM7701673.1 hypothetical protein [Metabacillus iocasae]
MGNTMVKSQLELVEQKLLISKESLNAFLNNTTITSLQHEQKEDLETYKLLLSSLRRLAVFCEEGLDACHVITHTEPFRKAAAEKTLYRIYHQCIEEFFNPKHDLWFEDSRSAYTGRNSIKYRFVPPTSISKLMVSLESDFQLMREELQFYETDYITKMKQSQ